MIQRRGTVSIPMDSRMMFVVKRSGKSEKVHIEKISSRIDKLCYGLDLNNLDTGRIVQYVVAGLHSGVTTCELDNLAAETCHFLSTLHPDYGTLAARIFVANLHKETKKSFSQVMTDLYNHTDPKTGKWIPLVNQKFYDDVMTNADIFDSAIVSDRDYSLNYFGLKTMVKAYLKDIDDRVVERPGHMFMRVAVEIHGSNVERVLETYEYMSLRQFIHATPTLFNAGGIRKGLSSCFLVALDREDDSIENIFKKVGECGSIAKGAGGIGLNIHEVRAKDSLIHSTNGKSRGIIPLLKVINEVTKYVTQSDKRPGSNAIYLEPWHAEIMDFLELRIPAGEEEKRARELFYALWIPDLFMEKVKNNDMWCLFCPNEAPGLASVYGEDFKKLYEKYESEGLYREKVKAQDVFERITTSQMKTGVPYILYKDAVNRKNNQSHIGTIRSSNLCCEITIYSSHDETAVCNLASIGLPAYIYHEKNGKVGFDYKALHQAAKVLTRNLDNVIDVTHYPSEAARKSNFRHRPIGIGVSGLADAFALLRMPYGSNESRQVNKWIFETILHGATEMSSELAQERGSYPSFEGSEYAKGNFQFDLWERESGNPIEHSGMWDWEELREKMKNGMRNSLLTACMPTATTSQIIGYSECTEPFNALIYKRETLVGEFNVVNKHLLQDLVDLGIWNEELESKIVENNGSVQGIPDVPQSIQDLYKTSFDMSQKVIIDLCADRAPYIDQSQSMNIFMKAPTHGKLDSMHFYAFEKGLKTGMYYLKMQPVAKPVQVTVRKEDFLNTVPSKGIMKAEIKESCRRDDAGCISCSS